MAAASAAVAEDPCGGGALKRTCLCVAGGTIVPDEYEDIVRIDVWGTSGSLGCFYVMGHEPCGPEMTGTNRVRIRESIVCNTTANKATKPDHGRNK